MKLVNFYLFKTTTVNQGLFNNNVSVFGPLIVTNAPHSIKMLIIETGCASSLNYLDKFSVNLKFSKIKSLFKNITL